MGKASAPPAPDYGAAARQQGAANVETAQAQAMLGNPNVFSPYGQRTVTYAPALSQQNFNSSQYLQSNPDLQAGGFTPDMAYQHFVNSGQREGRQGYYNDPNLMQPTVTEQFTPEGMQRYQQEQRIIGNLGGVAEQGLGRVSSAMEQPFTTQGLPGQVSSVGQGNYAMGPQANNLQTGYGSGGQIQGQLDYSGAPQLPGVDDFSADRRRVEDALMARINEQYDRDFEAQQGQLLQRGFAPGTQASNQRMQQLDRARNDAMFNALMAGGQEQSRLFGMGLQARQQGIGEINNQGQFANAAQAQGNAQNQGQAQFYNQAMQNQFGMEQQSAQMQNQVAQAQMQEAMQNANLANQARQQGLQEQAFLRQIPLNELNALRTGSQVQAPQFQPYQGAQIGQTPIFGAAQATAQQQQNAYNQQIAQNNATMGGLFGLGSAGIMAFSDRRLKSNIKQVGVHPLGIGIYEYDIFGNRERGVMADEVLKVRPEAVLRADNGYLMVNYGAL
jgi:hypothetical protein